MMRLTEGVPVIVIQDGDKPLMWTAWYRGKGYVAKGQQHALRIIQKKVHRHKKKGKHYQNAGQIWAMPEEFYAAWSEAIIRNSS